MSKLMDGLRKLLAESEVEETDESEHTDGLEGGDGEQLEDEGEQLDDEGEQLEDEGEQLEDEGEGEQLEGTEGTTPNEDAATAELRQTITDQAALIESLRNQIAALGGEVDEDEDEAEAANLDTDDQDAIDAFDSDYAVREAALAEMKKGI